MEVEGEYGWPGAECPGVRRLVDAMTKLEGIGQSPAVGRSSKRGSDPNLRSAGEQP
jgi:hypothetical protein